MFFPRIRSKTVLISLTISIVLTVLSVILIIRVFPDLIKNEIFKNVRLIRGTEQYDRFLEIPFPVSFKVFVFNVENPNEIISGQKPVVKEIGPFVYKLHWTKLVHGTNEDDDTISYIDQQIYEFDSEASGNLSDTNYVTVANPVMLGILQLSEKFGQAHTVSNCLTDILDNINTLFINVKVKDLLFDGLKFCPRHLSLCELPKNIVCKMAAQKKNMDKLEDDSLQFSFFNYKNKSHETLYTITRGIKDVLTLGQTVTIDNSPYTQFWNKLHKNSTCDLVKGSYISLYPPQISEESTFKIYSTDVCRSVEINFLKEKYYKGIKGYMFAPNNSSLRSKFANKVEDCFCAEQTLGTHGENTCFLDGVLDMQPCSGAPALLSFPHFLWADKIYLDGVNGLSPNEAIHKTYLLVEPVIYTFFMSI
ncbi:hypothetical protein Zmor_006804 [Zophobas morio]|uniref:Sensory neuron membrane protein 2 n=1 Tax=Zophobas morio TaxID=2755281 RepID=A0AA38IXW5_9CUCU|nr:hypothetical protein Zmor_006804 [Zophobas morio]